MTLLVLELRPPSMERSLPAELGHLWAPLFAYGLSFLVLGVLWFGHHTQFENVERVDHPLVWLNILFLAFVSLVPFSAAVLGRFLTSPIAVLIYGINLTTASLFHSAMWLYATTGHRLISKDTDLRFLRWSRKFALLPSLGYGLGTLACLLSTKVAVSIYFLVPVPFVTGLYYRLFAWVTHGRPLDEDPV